VISLTLPSIRVGALRRTLDNINQTTRNFIEVIVVAPFSFDYQLRNGKIVWLKEETPLGCNGGHELAAKHATQNFIAPWVDDHLFINGWDLIVLWEFMVPQIGMRCIGLRHAIEPQVGTVFGKYYPYFPVMRKADVEAIGWFSGEYKRGFADCDLALRVWDKGGICVPSEVGVVLKHPDDSRKMDDLMEGEARCLPQDMDLFLRRWSKKYGAGYDLSRIRGFNQDILL
jgi:hypothetical protein